MAIKIRNLPWATPLEPEELDEIIPWYITTQGELNELEAVNIIKWLKWSKTARWDIFSESFCKKLHKNMFWDVWKWAWEFRKSDKNIWCQWNNIWIELRDVLETWKYWLNNKTFSIHEIAIRFHHRLVSVHPFPNGNWRFSRAMADVLIMKEKEKPLLWNSIWNLESTSGIRTKYLESLRKADNWDYWDLIKLFSPK